MAKKVLKQINGQLTASQIKDTITKLDNKYFGNITELVASYITEYMHIAHPGTEKTVVDEKINLWANTWNVELLREIMNFEGVPENSIR